jgi:HAD superfamily hydrolase (TIGR01509 family)
VFDYYFTLADPDAACIDHEELAAWRATRTPDVDRDPARFVLLGERWERHGGASLRASRERDHAMADAYDDVAPVLASLRAGGFLLGVMSDADCAWLHASIARNRLELEAVVCSEDVGCYKPNPTPFLAIAEALGVEPEEAVYVGDTPRLDVAGARDVGMTAVWLNRRALTWPEELAPPDHSIVSLLELIEIVEIVDNR